FIAEEIYRNLRTDGMPESVHLCDYPTAGALARDEELERQMATAMALTGLGRNVRKSNKLNVRQPLARGAAFVMNGGKAVALPEALQEVIREELNLKAIEFPERPGDWLTVSLKPNFPALGPRFGKKLGKIGKALAGLASEKVLGVLFSGAGTLAVEVDGERIELDTGRDVGVVLQAKEGMAVASDGVTVMALDTALTPELIREGLGRELVNRIQNLRKESGLEVSDRIRLRIEGDDELREAAEACRNFIGEETLSANIDFAPLSGDVTFDVNGHGCRLELYKA
ncbi:MAG: isoleucine--tRNA ligase, partial [Kiritimatiellae bacterium]|nr:isoleucine--tRNA ligase [Kiritimatiellia bacterium]